MGVFTGSEQRVKIRDSYLDLNRTTKGSRADINLITLSPAEAFENLNSSTGRGVPKSGPMGTYEPRGISLNGADGAELTADDGIINGTEKGDSSTNFMTERHTCGVIHRNSYKVIRPRYTTGRGIIVHG